LKPELQREVYTVKDRPEVGVPYSKVIQFKLGSRKSVYRQDETITLDLALLNTSGDPLFIQKPELPFLSFRVVRDGGSPVETHPYATVLGGVTPASFRYLAGSGLLTTSLHVLIGCNSKRLSEFQKAQREMVTQSHLDERLYDRLLFERDLFTSWGDGCLASIEPGTYTFSAEITNECVVKSDCEPLIKTAIGTIESQPLKIRIQDRR